MQKSPRIDTSELPHGKTVKIRDRAYLDSFKGRPCMICGATDTTVAAHIRKGGDGGMGLKPSDNLVMPLCYAHHMEQSRAEESFWRKYCGWRIERARAEAMELYEEWKNEQR